jgi:hypothetical protein
VQEGYPPHPDHAPPARRAVLPGTRLQKLLTPFWEYINLFKNFAFPTVKNEGEKIHKLLAKKLTAPSDDWRYVGLTVCKLEVEKCSVTKAIST